MSSPIVPISTVVHTLATAPTIEHTAQQLGLDVATVHQVVAQLCCCFPGMCRGGQVVGGRTVCGQLCREAL